MKIFTLIKSPIKRNNLRLCCVSTSSITDSATTIVNGNNAPFIQDTHFYLYLHYVGNKIASALRNHVKSTVIDLKRKYNSNPGLALVLVGNQQELRTTVSLQKKYCSEVGINVTEVFYPAEISQDTIIDEIRSLNSNANIHGISLQLPLPSHINEFAVVNEIDPEKDIDGQHQVNIRNLLFQDDIIPSKDTFHYYTFNLPCTPQAVIEILDHENINVIGKDTVVIGRSNVVGLPLSLLLIKKSATVTILHSLSQNIQDKIKLADIVIVAIGKAEFIKGEWIKPGAVVIDVGINAVVDETSHSGKLMRNNFLARSILLIWMLSYHIIKYLSHQYGNIHISII